MRVLIVIMLGLPILAAVQGKQLPKGIKKCHFGDTKCIADAINAVIRQYPKGIPEIGMKAIDAVDVKDTLLIDDPPHGVAWYSFKLLDQVNYGFENTTITEVKGFSKNPTATSMEIHGQIPSLIYKGNYVAKGRMLWLVEIFGSGESISDFQNFRFVIKLKVQLEYRNNKRYLRIYELVPNIDLDRWIMWLDGFFPDNTDLTIAINQLFNANWVEFWNELEPPILRTFTSVFSSMIEDIFHNVAYDDMFLPDET